MGKFKTLLNLSKKISLLLCFLFFSRGIQAQFLEDQQSQRITKNALDDIYNYRFTRAEQSLASVFAKYKHHPVSPLLKALILYWKYKPVAHYPHEAKKYLAELEECKRLGEILLKNEKYKAEATFYLLSAHGFISKYHHFNKDYLKAAFEAKNAYGYLKDGFNYVTINPDFLFTTGLYQYYRVVYPESHVAVKPIIYFFKEGNKTSGLNNLRKASKEALFSQVEATDYLGNICLKYENRNAEALSCYLNLHKKYPNNPNFLLKYIESLLANGKQNEAEPEIGRLSEYKQIDCKVAYFTFRGEVESRKGNKDAAKRYFLEALKIKGNGYHTDELRAMIYLGLGKSAISLKENAVARKYLNQCLDIAEYRSVISEAKKLLKTL